MGKYLNKIRQHESAQLSESPKPDRAVPYPQEVDAPSRPIQPGDRISWTRSDGSVHSGVVDFLHVDSDQTSWAFVTLEGSGWAATTTQFARRV